MTSPGLLQSLYDNSPTLAHYFPEWLTGTETGEVRIKNYREMVEFLKHKGIVRGELPPQLFTMMQAYLQDGTPIYYEDPMRRFTLWVGAGEPDKDSKLFYRL